jgi:hypothetical protein
MAPDLVTHLLFMLLILPGIIILLTAIRYAFVWIWYASKKCCISDDA